MRTATLLLVGPNTLARVGLKSLLRESPFTVVGEVSDGALTRGSVDARALPVSHPVLDVAPDIVLLVCLGDPHGVVEALARLRAVYPDAPAVVLSDTVQMAALRACFAAGAAGFLSTDISRAALLHSLQLAVLGETVFPTGLAGLLVHGIPAAPSRPPGPNVSGLSDREVETVQCLMHGESNKLIANRLRVTEATIKVHIKSVMRKIKVSNRTQAAIWAHSHGFLPLHVAAQADGSNDRIGRR